MLIQNKNGIKIKYNYEKNFSMFSYFTYEDDKIYYSREKGFIEMVTNKTIDELSQDMIIDAFATDSKRILHFYKAAVKNKNISSLFTMHSKRDINKQIIKIIKSNVFPVKDVVDYIINNYNSKGKSVLYKNLVLEIYKHKSFNKYKNILLKDYISEDDFLGEGSTRIAYKFGDDLVIKIHKNDLGTEQSINEYGIYNHPDFENFIKYLSEPLYITNTYSIYNKYHKYNKDNSFNKRDEEAIKNLEIINSLSVLLEEHDIIPDFLDTNNLGLTKENKLIFLDYGASEYSITGMDSSIYLDSIKFKLVLNRLYSLYNSPE